MDGIAVVVNKGKHRRQPDQGSDRSDLQGARSPTGRTSAVPMRRSCSSPAKPAPAPAAPLKRSAADRKERRRQRGLPRGREQGHHRRLHQRGFHHGFHQENATVISPLGSYDSSLVTALDVDGVACTQREHRGRHLLIARPFLLISGPATDDVAKAFLDYAMSARRPGRGRRAQVHPRRIKHGRKRQTSGRGK